MNENVILLGAGASYNAEIPLLGNFIERFKEVADRGRQKDYKLTEPERDIFNKAIEIWRDIGKYHRISNIDDWNLEDILSILEFNAFSNKSEDKENKSIFVAAISRAIELFCTVKRDSRPSAVESWQGDIVYKDFWSSLFRAFGKHDMPTIVTLNYDLVLERSLFASIHGEYEMYGSDGPVGLLPDDNLMLDYCLLKPSQKYHIVFKQMMSHGDRYTRHFNQRGYEIFDDTKHRKNNRDVRITFAKLHGSLNFCNGNSGEVDVNWSKVLDPCETPVILPPNFNKASISSLASVWKCALGALRTAKNIIICGYSLPRTDIYMQYFLKTALGPNHDINRITIFDPVLFRGDMESEVLANRYLECFTKQFHKRIEMKPYAMQTRGFGQGTFEHLVNTLYERPEQSLYLS